MRTTDNFDAIVNPICLRPYKLCMWDRRIAAASQQIPNACRPKMRSTVSTCSVVQYRTTYPHAGRQQAGRQASRTNPERIPNKYRMHTELRANKSRTHSVRKWGLPCCTSTTSTTRAPVLQRGLPRAPYPWYPYEYSMVRVIRISTSTSCTVRVRVEVRDYSTSTSTIHSFCTYEYSYQQGGGRRKESTKVYGHQSLFRYLFVRYPYSTSNYYRARGSVQVATSPDQQYSLDPGSIPVGTLQKHM